MVKKSSVFIAKNRLKQLVSSDRMLCIPDSYETLSSELYKILSKYIDISEDSFRMEIKRTHILIHFSGEKAWDYLK